MNETKRERASNIKHEASRPKGELMRLLDKMAEVSAPEARKLERIIGKLETWQNTGLGT